jgi:hypothetical protein
MQRDANMTTAMNNTLLGLVGVAVVVRLVLVGGAVTP